MKFEKNGYSRPAFSSFSIGLLTQWKLMLSKAARLTKFIFLSKEAKKRRRLRKRVIRNTAIGQEGSCDLSDDADDVGGEDADDGGNNLPDPLTMTAGTGGGNSLKHIRIWSRCMIDLVRKMNNFHQPGNERILCV